MRCELDASIPPVNFKTAKSHPQKIEGGFFLRKNAEHLFIRVPEAWPFGPGPGTSCRKEQKGF